LQKRSIIYSILLSKPPHIPFLTLHPMRTVPHTLPLVLSPSLSVSLYHTLSRQHPPTFTHTCHEMDSFFWNSASIPYYGRKKEDITPHAPTLFVVFSLPLSSSLVHTHTLSLSLSRTHTHTRMRRYAGGGCRLGSQGARIKFHKHRACQKELCICIKTAPYMYPHIHAAQKMGGDDV